MKRGVRRGRRGRRGVDVIAVCVVVNHNLNPILTLLHCRHVNRHTLVVKIFIYIHT